MGLTSFGGPSAHLGYFRKEYVERRGWLSEEAFAELVAVVQFLPGPSSSQLGAAIGFSRARWTGAAAAWLGFTTPYAVAMAAFAAAAARLDVSGAVWLHALKLVAVAIVLDAVGLGFVAAVTAPSSGHESTLGGLAAGMYRFGALVFGGGHVVLPLLQVETVSELVSPDAFLGGYGVAQAVPGPLFTFATFPGQTAAGVPGAVVATVAIFLP